LRALAISSAQRFADLPEVPTVSEAGGPALQRFELSSWNALAAPARTAPEVLARLNLAANQALAQPALQRQWRALGVRPQGGTPEQLRAALVAETRHWAEVVRAARIEPT
jgi:tripartite-type tricarboxylate transporter receptor subunit TctC